ncbi:binding-protein-dependent transporters inner membrane component [Paenibacillus sabinae T27]|uniref:Binding-protein-dependent transporters inner membrane component n=1 Tax=Paenibacillus sabinae T27 TaxID=1268072 RepID=X4ZFG3_9BACL|nr:binding-protein-dependent transporters inner membrane component [Paenibacillus sabinae T27]
MSAHIHRLVLVLLLVVNIYPLLWMILNSLKTEQELSMNPFGLARKPMWSIILKPGKWRSWVRILSTVLRLRWPRSCSRCWSELWRRSF